MSDFGSTVSISAPGDDVFAFLCEPANMPRFLPTVQAARRVGKERIELDGEVDGKSYQSQGWFEVDDQHLMIRWGSEGDNRYAGHLTVTPMTGSTCKVEIRLMFSLGLEQKERYLDQAGRPDQAIQNGLDQTVASIKDICERTRVRALEEEKQNRRGYIL